MVDLGISMETPPSLSLQEEKPSFSAVSDPPALLPATDTLLRGSS